MKSLAITFQKSNLKFLFLFVTFLSVSTMCFGQTIESDETPNVVIPDQAKEQIVRRILVWYFKPRNEQKVIYLAEKGLQKSWLPEIKGIEFQLLSEAEVNERESVYFFTKLEKSTKDKYHIGFANGDPECSYSGESWYFRIIEQKARLWKSPSEGFGGGCGSGGSQDFP